MRKQLLLSLCPLIFLIHFNGYSQCDPSEQCLYSFKLIETFGDGWNGNTMSVYQNGNFVAALEHSNGFEPIEIQTVALCHDQPFTLFWNTGGSFPSEVGVEVVNPFGQTIYSKPPNTGSQGTLLYSGMTNCLTDVCLPPLYLQQVSVTGDSATISWETFGTTNEWEVIVLPLGSPAPTASSVGVITTVPTFTATGLNPDGVYDIYVRSHCWGTTASDWSAPISVMSTCFTPTNISAEANGTTGYISWPYNSNFPNIFEVFIQIAGEPAPGANATGVITGSNFYDATGLIAGQSYDVYVRTVCSETSSSNWSVPATFDVDCEGVSNITISGLSEATSISWASMATEWEIIIQDANDPAPTEATTGVVTSNNPYVVSGLTIGNSYAVYIRAICAPGVVSAWSEPKLFMPYTTLPPLTSNTTLYTPSQLISDVLVSNPCIEISNVTSSTGSNFGSVNGIGYFTNSNPTFPLSAGLVLSTGNAMSVAGPNLTILSEGDTSWLGDLDLENIILAGTGLQMNSKNATKLEFDFTTTHEFMSFNFLLASDEYGTFQCSFADAFAFLLTDLETGITTNIAVVPGTVDPVSVVTIRNEQYNPACPSVNPGFFDSYSDSELNGAYMSATNFNGQTALMTASSPIQPNHPYHIKLVVADRGDTAYDSAVFIEAGSFSAGPPECNDKIKLVAFVDGNNNGVKDPGEANFTYGSFTSEMNSDDLVSITSPIGTYVVYDANPDNTYAFGYVVNSEYAPYYAVGATSYNGITIPVGSGTQILYFPISLIQDYNDVTVTIVPVSPPVAGSTFKNKVVYTNLGVAAASGNLTFVKDPAVTITEVSQPGTVSNPDGFTFAYSDLQPYESRSMMVTMSVPAIPAVNIDDVLTSSASISSNVGDGSSPDINLANNTASNSQVVVASYDPNDKMESHGGKIQFNQFSQDDYLFYTIRFQNTGTTNAVNIRLEDFLDAQIDPESIRMVNASHNYTMLRTGNKVVWNFDFIQLPPQLQSDALSQGYVTFKVKLNPGFAIGDIIPNTADIYFDSNPAITTNTCNTEFFALLANANFNEGNLLMFPNPANNSVQISILNTNEILDNVTVYDVLGKTVRKIAGISSVQTTMDVSALSNGVYIVEIGTESGGKQIRKLVIQ